MAGPGEQVDGAHKRLGQRLEDERMEAGDDRHRHGQDQDRMENVEKRRRHREEEDPVEDVERKRQRRDDEEHSRRKRLKDERMEAGDNRHRHGQDQDRMENGEKRRRHREEEDPVEDGQRKRQRRDDEEHTRRKRRKHELTDSDSQISSASQTSLSDASSSDESSDGGRRRERRRKKKERRKSRHGSEKEKTKSKKRKKRRRRDTDTDEDDNTEKERKRRLLKEAKKLLKRHKRKEDSIANEHRASGTKVEQISSDDYFLKSSEFATYLKEERGVLFSNLSSEETHKIFETFVDKWNGGRLKQKYYDGIKQAPRTNHNWGIKKGPEDSFVVDEEEEYAIAKKKDKYDRKKFRKDQEVLLDEMLPKATGRERLMEQKAIRREQARSRDDSPDLKERDVMGGGGDFQERLAREKARREKRQAEKAAVYNEKRSAFEEKETATMDQLRSLVNVAGGRITIAKRNVGQ